MDFLIRILAVLLGPIIIAFTFKLIYQLVVNLAYNIKFTKRLKIIEPYLNEIRIDEIEADLLKIQRLNEDVNISLKKSFKMRFDVNKSITINDFLPPKRLNKLEYRTKKRRKRKKQTK